MQHLGAGGAVAGPVAASALVGIGAAALTGGAVLDAVGFPRSPGKVPASLPTIVVSGYMGTVLEGMVSSMQSVSSGGSPGDCTLK